MELGDTVKDTRELTRKIGPDSAFWNFFGFVTEEERTIDSGMNSHDCGQSLIAKLVQDVVFSDRVMTEKLNKRRFFRLVYPTSVMPITTIDDVEYAIPEISEGGIRLRVVSNKIARTDDSRATNLATANDGRKNHPKETFVIGNEIRCEIGLLCGETIVVRALSIGLMNGIASLQLGKKFHSGKLYLSKEFCLGNFQDCCAEEVCTENHVYLLQPESSSAHELLEQITSSQSRLGKVKTQKCS